jgi:hypothetical protein
MSGVAAGQPMGSNAAGMGAGSGQATPAPSQLNLKPPVNDGSTEVKVTFPTDGQYIAFVDFRPLGGNKVLLAVPIKVGTAATTATTLAPDTSFTRPVGDLLVSLQLDGTLQSGQENKLSFTAVDPEGQSRNEDILMLSGNQADLYAIDEKATIFLRQSLVDPNQLQFSVNFPKPGRYKIWFDFLYQSQPEQISFVLDVK